MVFSKVIGWAGGVAIAAALGCPAAALGTSHDFDPGTLAAYQSLRFSSAVPSAVIRRLLAGEGFSQRDVDLTTASAYTGRSRAAQRPLGRSSCSARRTRASAFATLKGRQLRFFGDYAGIAASPSAANAIWDQAQNFADEQVNPTNTHQRTFSARVP